MFCTITEEKDLTGQLLLTERSLLNSQFCCTSAGSSGAGVTYVAEVLTIAVVLLDYYYLLGLTFSQIASSKESSGDKDLSSSHI